MYKRNNSAKRLPAAPQHVEQGKPAKLRHPKKQPLLHNNVNGALDAFARIARASSSSRMGSSTRGSSPSSSGPSPPKTPPCIPATPQRSGRSSENGDTAARPPRPPHHHLPALNIGISGAQPGRNQEEVVEELLAAKVKLLQLEGLLAEATNRADAQQARADKEKARADELASQKAATEALLDAANERLCRAEADLALERNGSALRLKEDRSEAVEEVRIVQEAQWRKAKLRGDLNAKTKIHALTATAGDLRLALLHNRGAKLLKYRALSDMSPGDVTIFRAANMVVKIYGYHSPATAERLAAGEALVTQSNSYNRQPVTLERVSDELLLNLGATGATADSGVVPVQYWYTDAVCWQQGTPLDWGYDRQLVIVMDYFPNGDVNEYFTSLLDKLEEKEAARGESLSAEAKARCAVGAIQKGVGAMAQPVAQLHSLGLVHSDLKPLNAVLELTPGQAIAAAARAAAGGRCSCSTANAAAPQPSAKIIDLDFAQLVSYEPTIGYDCTFAHPDLCTTFFIAPEMRGLAPPPTAEQLQRLGLPDNTAPDASTSSGGSSSGGSAGGSASSLRPHKGLYSDCYALGRSITWLAEEAAERFGMEVEELRALAPSVLWAVEEACTRLAPLDRPTAQEVAAALLCW